MHRPRILPVAATVALAALVAATPAAYATGDLDNDGRDDLAVGSPSEDVSQVNDAGQVNILMGAGGGLSPSGDLIIDQADFGGTVEESDRFGNAIAYGDFDGDGFDDVAIGAPAEDWSGERDAGVVHVIYGSNTGPRTSSVQLLSQSGPMAGANESGDFFGAVLAAGDFDDDGYDDLVISVVGENFANKVAAGGVTVAFGSRNGITTSGSKAFSQRGKVPGAAEAFDAFGFAIAVGDFDNNGHDDIAVGAPGEDISGAEDAGAVTIFFGQDNGLRKRNTIAFSQNGVAGALAAGNEFGYSLAAGDFDDDGIDDLAVGVKGQDGDTGGVVVLPGRGSGGPVAGESYALAATALSGASAASGDQYGYTLAAGNFDGQGADDLAIGAPFADAGGQTDAGRVVIAIGSGSGLSGGATLVVDHGTIGSESPEAGDRFGESLRVGDFNGDNRDDLAVAAPFESRGGRTASGIVNILYGGASGLDLASAERWSQNTGGVRGTSETGDRFGEGL